jgi:hypothetical protein
MGSGSTKNRSSLSWNQRRTRKQDPHFLSFLFSQSHSQNRGSRRAMMKSNGLQSGKSYGSVNMRLHVYIISLSIRYQRSVKESKKNLRMGKALMLLTSIQGCTRMSRTPGPGEGFGTEDEVYCLGRRGSMKSLLRRKPPTVLLLFQRTHL